MFVSPLPPHPDCIAVDKTAVVAVVAVAVDCCCHSGWVLRSLVWQALIVLRDH